MNKKLQKRFFIIAMIVLSYVAVPILFLMRILNKSRAGDAPRFLLIPQLTRIGDVICTTPVFRAIKKAYPNSHIAVFVSVMTSSLMAHNPYVDEIIQFEDYSFFQLAKKIRTERFDWCVSFSGTSLSTLIAVWGMIPRRVKITRPDRPLTESLTDWMVANQLVYKDHSYLPQVYLNMLKYAGITSSDTAKEVFTSPDGERKAEMFMSSQALSSTDTIVGISVTAGNAIKEWGDDKFSELASRIIDEYKAKIVFIGSSRDSARISRLIAGFNESYRPSCIQATDFSLEDLPSLIKRFSFFISGDTGPMHMAHALGVPLIDIIGPVHPDEQAPRDGMSIIVKPKGSVAPTIFAFEKAGAATLSREALDSTSVEDVFRAFSGLRGQVIKA
jgi:ADP-heptose:LPS heptosyltransferase